MARSRVNFVHPLLRARDYQNRPEFDRLCDWWRGGGQGVCALVGIGGAGKTAIADRFLRVLPGAMADDPNLPKDDTLPAPAGLFVFSFYKAENPDAFVAALAAWLEHRPPDDRAKPHSYEQMLRLLQGAGDCLLVLDGLEKVQDPGLRGGVFGQITDGRLRDFVLRVAEGYLPGVRVIITTRFAMPDLEEERCPNYAFIPIDEISQQSGIALLRDRGVRGTEFELLRIVNECGCHALTVDMAGGYIAEFGGGDANTKLELGTVEELEQAIKDEPDPRRRRVLKQEFRFARIARRYEEGLSESDPAAMALLQRVCLFRLSVDAKTLASIFTGEGKEGISGPELVKLSFEQLGGKLKLLVKMRLIEESGREEGEVPSSGNQHFSFSIHPAVRDGFLAGLDAETAQRGHDAARKGLEASLGGQPGDNPSDPATLDLLEEIVHHTLTAGHANEAWDIYWNRIGEYSNLGWRLGAYERGERICRAFADGQPPQTAALPDRLSENDQAVFINEWAMYLKDLGRLDAAARCYERSIETLMPREDWKNASIGNHNLAEVSLWSGRLTAALRGAEGALRLAERANDSWARWDSHAIRGNARALRGETDVALADFRDALRWQHESEGNTDEPLWSLPGIWHARLLIRLGRHKEATRLTEENHRICIEFAGQAYDKRPQVNLLLADLARQRGDLAGARCLLAEAHGWAIARDAKEPLCWSALVRGRIELSRVRCADQSKGTDTPNGPHSGPYDEARAAIDDGLRIARDCGFGIYHIDLLLLRAQVALHEGRATDAERGVRLALDEGVHPAADTGLPELLAATDEECGYAWGIAEGRHLLAEALLLQAAQELHQTEFAPARFDSLPDEVRKLIEEARGQLTQCRDLRKRIQDPKLAETEQTLSDLRGGALTNYPLEPVSKKDSEAPPPPHPCDVQPGAAELGRPPLDDATGGILLDKCKILFLAANPAGTAQLALDEEIREIQTKIRAAEYRDTLHLTSRWAVRPDDLLQSLNEERPHIVHFGGHGTPSEELVLKDSAGNAKSVSKKALVSLFKALKDNIRLVVLNACYSKPQAEAIVEIIDCAIGMKKTIGDKAAITFAGSFYRAVGFGRSVQEAFDQGVTSLLLEGIPEEHTPVLLCRTGVSPESTFLLQDSCIRTVRSDQAVPVQPGSTPIAKKHVFLSYCRDNATEVAKLRDDLIAGGEAVWWDKDILPGEDWKFTIRQAMKDSYAVMLCLSKETEARETSGMFPEALDAIAAYREYAPGSIFLIPVRLSKCTILPFEIDGTRTLDCLQYEDLFPAAKRSAGLQRLIKALQATPHHP